MPLWLYNSCAIVGGTLFLCQLAMTLLGLGGHDADAGADHDIGADHEAGHDSAAEHGQGFSLNSLLSVRALVAGVTFFGLAGRAAASGALSSAAVLAIAAGVGLAGLSLVGLLMGNLRKLEAEGTVHIEQALGEEAVVYLTIPARNSGPGKITVTVQNRLMEYPAVTDSPEALPTGTPVEVVDLVDGETLKVARLLKADAPAASAEGQNPVTGKNPPLARNAAGAEHG
ncbi:MAG: hypothetical protein ABSE73_15425 [Planctomycetota bacterium]